MSNINFNSNINHLTNSNIDSTNNNQSQNAESKVGSLNGLSVKQVAFQASDDRPSISALSTARPSIGVRSEDFGNSASPSQANVGGLQLKPGVPIYQTANIKDVAHQMATIGKETIANNYLSKFGVQLGQVFDDATPSASSLALNPLFPHTNAGGISGANSAAISNISRNSAGIRANNPSSASPAANVANSNSNRASNNLVASNANAASPSAASPSAASVGKQTTNNETINNTTNNINTKIKIKLGGEHEFKHFVKVAEKFINAGQLLLNKANNSVAGSSAATGSNTGSTAGSTAGGSTATNPSTDSTDDTIKEFSAEVTDLIGKLQDLIKNFGNVSPSSAGTSANGAPSTTSTTNNGTQGAQGTENAQNAQSTSTANQTKSPLELLQGLIEQLVKILEELKTLLTNSAAGQTGNNPATGAPTAGGGQSASTSSASQPSQPSQPSQSTSQDGGASQADATNQADATSQTNAASPANSATPTGEADSTDSDSDELSTALTQLTDLLEKFAEKLQTQDAKPQIELCKFNAPLRA